jgi:hypothetical protein
MELAKLILEFLKVLIWPVTTAVLVILFRTPITRILTRIRNFGLPGGVTIDLQNEIDATTELSKDALQIAATTEKKSNPVVPMTEANAAMISLGLQPVSSGLSTRYFLSLADSDPTLALAALRIEIETLLKNMAHFIKDPIMASSPTPLLRSLQGMGIIPPIEADLLANILRLCNRAIHGDLTITVGEAKQVINSAEAFFLYYLVWLSGIGDHLQGEPE